MHEWQCQDPGHLKILKFWVFEYGLSVFILKVQTEYLEKVGTARED